MPPIPTHRRRWKTSRRVHQHRRGYGGEGLPSGCLLPLSGKGRGANCTYLGMSCSSYSRPSAVTIFDANDAPSSYFPSPLHPPLDNNKRAATKHTRTRRNGNEPPPAVSFDRTTNETTGVGTLVPPSSRPTSASRPGPVASSRSLWPVGGRESPDKGCGLRWYVGK